MKIEATVKEIRALLELAELDQSADHPRSEARRQAREAAVRRVPRRAFDQYQRLIEAGRAPVVVAIVQGACSGCHLRLPTMVESMTRRSPAVHTCPHCGRMLYAPQLVREDAGVDDGTPSRRAAEASTARRSCWARLAMTDGLGHAARGQKLGRPSDDEPESLRCPLGSRSAGTAPGS